MSSYEDASLTEIEAVLDGLEEATSSEVYYATKGYQARAVAAVAASRADAAAAAGPSPAFGFHAFWTGSPLATVSDSGSWATDDAEPSGVDFDEGPFNVSAPFFVPNTPEEGGAGVYLLVAQFVFDSVVDGGFVTANAAGSTQGLSWAPVISALAAGEQTVTAVVPIVLDDEDNSLDVANFVNRSGHDVLLLRADYWGLRLSGAPSA